MNPRERILAVFLVAVILFVGGGVLGYRFYWVPWNERSAALARLQKEAGDKKLRLDEIDRDRAKLVLWRQLSLPADVNVARREYGMYLTDLLGRSGVTATITAPQVDLKSSPTLPGKKEPIYTKITFNVQVYATMGALVKALEEFYRTGVMHQIRSMTLQRQLTAVGQSQVNELDVHLVIEALIVTGADNRTWLLPNIDRRLLALDLASGLCQMPTGLGLALWAAGPTGLPEIDHGPLRARQDGGFHANGEARTSTSIEVTTDTARDYSVLAVKNIFLGRPPSDQTEGAPMMMAPRYVYLNGITTSRSRLEATLYDRANNRPFKLRPSYGSNTFPLIRDANARSVVLGEVVHLDERDLVFRVRINAEEAGSASEGPGLFALDPKEKAALLADKVIEPGEEDLVFRVDRAYWETLVRLKVFRVRDSDPTSFRIQLERASEQPAEDDEMGDPPVEVTRGKVLRRAGGELLIKVEDRHYGMHYGQNVEDALKKALPESKVKELRVAAGG